jgi:hypothetical protein
MISSPKNTKQREISSNHNILILPIPVLDIRNNNLNRRRKMSKTRHIQQRMSQRGIKSAMIDTVLNFGKTQGDKVILNRNGMDLILIELEKLKKNVLKMRERGGLVVVKVNGYLLTTYSVNSHRFNKNMSKSSR